METIANLWLLWLISLFGSLIYFAILSWDIFVSLVNKDAEQNDPEDKALTSITLQTFWPLILACVFLVLLALAGLYKIAAAL
jgi:hypothetical protein